MLSEGSRLALFSGFLAAASSFLAKLGLDESVTQLALPHWVELLLRGLLLLLTLLTNGWMLTTFTRALHLSNTAVEASLLNTASNLLVTAVCGVVAFRETSCLSPSWCLGAVLILLGTKLLVSSENSKEEKVA
jgi:hypothetical protein